MKKISILISVLIILIAGAIYFSVTNQPLTPSPLPSPTQTQSSILFPKGNETLKKGQTYTLKWQKGSGNTQIFLVDTSLESQGESVSIADRIYNVPNSGVYNYTIPTNIPDSTYVFRIGNLTSKPFHITGS